MTTSQQQQLLADHTHITISKLWLQVHLSSVFSILLKWIALSEWLVLGSLLSKSFCLYSLHSFEGK